MSEEKRGTGRHRKYPDGSRGPNITFRPPVVLRAQLLASADLSGRSLAEEVEYRLQRSYDREAMLDELRQALNELPALETKRYAA